MKIEYSKVKAIPFSKVLDRYPNDLREANVANDLKLVGHCPLCHPNGGKKPKNNQFQVTIQSKNTELINTFHCFSCHARGTIIDFVILKEGIIDPESVDWEQVEESRKSGSKWNWAKTADLKEASQLLHNWFIEKPPETTCKLGNVTWVERWGKPPTYPKFYISNTYLKSRGISQKILDQFGVGFYSNPRASSPYKSRILFPIHNQNGELIAFASRNTTEDGDRYLFPTADKFDRTLELYNLHRAIKEGTNVYVVEGFFDTMNLYQLGYRCVVGLMGCRISDDQADLLVQEFETATFILDPDKPGRKLGKQAMMKLLCRMPIRIVRGDKQPDEMTREEVETLLNG